MNPVLSKFLHVARCNDLQHGSVAIVEPSFWKRLRHEPWLLLSSVSMQHLFRNPLVTRSPHVASIHYRVFSTVAILLGSYNYNYMAHRMVCCGVAGPHRSLC